MGTQYSVKLTGIDLPKCLQEPRAVTFTAAGGAVVNFNAVEWKRIEVFDGKQMLTCGPLATPVIVSGGDHFRIPGGNLNISLPVRHTTTQEQVDKIVAKSIEEAPEDIRVALEALYALDAHLPENKEAVVEVLNDSDARFRVRLIDVGETPTLRRRPKPNGSTKE